MTASLVSERQHAILVIDDTPDNLSMMTGLLKELYKVKIAISGEAGLRIAQTDPPPDLILLDIMMPGIDGYEVCRRLKAQQATRDIPVIFLTARTDVDSEQQGFELGAVDFITKPISPPIVLARVQTHLTLKASADFLKDQNAFLEQEVARRTREVSAIQDVTILTMASLADIRDTDTPKHVRRIQHYVKALALRLRSHPRYGALLSEHEIDLLFRSAPLHDVGKVGIPDRILLKPGDLTAEEQAIMKTHTTEGFEAIDRAERALGTGAATLTRAKEIALSHHECWDGSGYPQGLLGDSIPLSARLLALADAYDGLVSRRVYQSGVAHEQAVMDIVAGGGRHFDPDVVDAFVDIHEEFSAIARRFADTDDDINRKVEYLSRSIAEQVEPAP
jgi:putative two-component system response regulator